MMEGDAETSLASAVINQAMADLAGLDLGRDAPGVRQAAIADARSFLTSTTGEWRRSREDWCAIAGICPDTLRQCAIEIIEMIDSGKRMNGRRFRDELKRIRQVYSRKPGYAHV